MRATTILAKILSPARMQNLIDLANAHKGTIGATLVAISGTSYYIFKRRQALVPARPFREQQNTEETAEQSTHTEQSSPKKRPAPIVTSHDASTDGPEMTPADQIDDSPPQEYGSLAPGGSFPEHHELMQRKKASKLLATASAGRDMGVVASMARARSIREGVDEGVVDEAGEKGQE
ncbi:hypothetical protein ACEQ8H_005410 [Pleosporales sp. CAS-2024a]